MEQTEWRLSRASERRRREQLRRERRLDGWRRVRNAVVWTLVGTAVVGGISIGGYAIWQAVKTTEERAQLVKELEAQCEADEGYDTATRVEQTYIAARCEIKIERQTDATN